MFDQNLIADKPKTDADDDQLGSSRFADTVADSLCQLRTNDSFVVALHGPWGSGKSTLLNFVVQNIRRRPRLEQPIIVRYNPWLFSDTDELARSFFHAVLKELEGERFSENVIRVLTKLSEVISEVPGDYGWLGKAGSKILNGTQRKDLVCLKEDVQSALRAQSRRILIIIDDIDRLLPKEMLEIFKLVKTVLDLPLITYFLAFDKNVVAESIGGELLHSSNNSKQVNHGTEFLHKIVQVPFDIPQPDHLSIFMLLKTRLSSVMSLTKSQLAECASLYTRGIDGFIRTPRDVTILTNAISVTYAGVSGEVHPVDFILIETLRMFCRTAYDTIRGNTNNFAGVKSSAIDRSPDLAEWHNEWLSAIDTEQQKPLKRIVFQLFPYVKTILGLSGLGSSYLNRWRRELRIASPEHVDTYFRFSLPTDYLTTTEMKQILVSARDQKNFELRMLNLAARKTAAGTTMLVPFFQRLDDFYQCNIMRRVAINIVQAFFVIGDQLVRETDCDEGLYVFDIADHISSWISRLLHKIDNQQRFELLLDQVRVGQSTGVIINTIRHIALFHERYGTTQQETAEQQTITRDQLNVLEPLALQRLEEFKPQIFLQPNSVVQTMVAAWKLWSLPSAKSWISEVTESDEGFVHFIEHYIDEERAETVTWLKDVMDVEQSISRMKQLLTAPTAHLTEAQRQTLTWFIDTYDKNVHAGTFITRKPAIADDDFEIDTGSPYPLVDNNVTEEDHIL